MRKQTTKTQSSDQSTHGPRLLSTSELEQVTGGTTTGAISNVMKTRHDTIKNSISNIR